MLLKVRSEERVALVVSVVAAALLFAALYFEMPVISIVFFGITIFFVTLWVMQIFVSLLNLARRGVSVFGITIFFVTLWVMRRFVAFRIKPIYQILLHRNTSTGEIEKRHKDLLGEIRTELQIWTDQSRNEIARLRENEKYRKEFVGNVSHELKTPIFSIQGYILTLLEGGLEDEQINRKYLQKAEANIERLINIVRDLEQISKLESTNLVLNVEGFDIAELVSESIESLEVLAAERQISVKMMCNDYDTFMVSADRKLISQVVINLLTNSIKYGKPGGYTKIHFIDVYGKIMIEVEDNGAGMEQAVLQRIFERFYRVDKGRSRNQGGTGLGLAIVKHVLEAHNQTITVRSTLNQGTTFSFTLDK